MPSHSCLPVAAAELRAHAEAQSSLVYTTNREGSRAIADQVRAVAPELLPEPVG